MNARKIREDLGRVRTCIQRKDFPRALYLLIISLKELGGQPAPTPLRGDFRSAISEICNHGLYRKNYSQPLGYQPGKENDLLAFFTKFYNKIAGKEEEEDYETALQRKINLDRCFNNGKVFVSQGKMTEADECFNEAFNYYKNEFAIFNLIAKTLMDAGQYVRALSYVRKGLKEKPDDPVLTKLAEECAQKR